MGTEIHKAVINGKTRYALFGTVVMQYRTGFGTRQQIIAALKRRGWKDDAIRRGMKNAYKVKATKKGKAVEISFPVYQVSLKGLKAKKVKRRK